MKQRFLSRNRLIAALTGATVVVEAAWRSGALSTARHAASLLRPVGAVPGPVTSMASAGCNQLLRDGVAVCVTDAAEAAELAGTIGGDLLGPAPPGAERLGLDRAGSDRPGSDRSEPGLPGATVARPSDGLDPTSLAVLDSLPARGLITLERLVAEAGQPLPAVLAALGLLELRGLVRADGSGWRLGGPGGAGASAGSVGVGSPGGAGASRVSAGGGGPGGAAIPGRAGPRRQTGSDE
jgi:DNA processing protein